MISGVGADAASAPARWHTWAARRADRGSTVGPGDESARNRLGQWSSVSARASGSEDRALGERCVGGLRLARRTASDGRLPPLP